MRPSASIIAAFALLSSVSAEIFVTEPVATTKCIAGQPCNVRWNDDGKTPALKDIGPTEIALYTGGQIQQTFLQMIQPEIDVSTNAQVTFLPDASVGEVGPYYFVRFTSKSLKSTANPLFPYQSFSAKFTIEGMTGTWNATVKSQIDGVVSSTSVPAPATSAPPSASTPAGSSASKLTTAVASSSSARASSSPSASAAPNSASSIAPVAGLFTSASTIVTAAGALIGMIALGL